MIKCIEWMLILNQLGARYPYTCCTLVRVCVLLSIYSVINWIWQLKKFYDQINISRPHFVLPQNSSAIQRNVGILEPNTGWITFINYDTCIGKHLYDGETSTRSDDVLIH